MTNRPASPRPDDDPSIPFVFVPHGTPVPDGFSGPDWISIPATFAPTGASRRTESGLPWPRDASGREWPADRLGQPDCPPWAMAPGVRRPGEVLPESYPKLPDFPPTQPPFRNAAETVNMFLNNFQVAAAGRSSGPSAADAAPKGPVTPAAPDQDKQWLVPRQPRKQPVYDIYVGGLGDESFSGPVLPYAQQQGGKGDHNVIYFPFDANVPKKTSAAALAAYIDSLPPDVRINVIGHSWGGDTAANAAILTSRRIDLLVTIDPVSRTDRPEYATVEAHVRMWIDVNATTAGASTKGNFWAGLGGPWGASPKGTATTFIDARANHEEFTKMMTTPGPDGITPQEALER